MGIGIKELIVLVVMLLFMMLLVAGIVWLVRAASRPSKAAGRSATERLAELEAPRKAGQITATEYEKQRATVVSSI